MFSISLQNVKISKSYLFQYKLEEGLYLGGGGAYDRIYFLFTGTGYGPKTWVGGL